MSSYDTLLSDIHEYLRRNDLAPLYPTFVRLTEDKHARDIRCRAMTTREDLIGDGTRYIALPDDFLEMRRLTFADDDSRQLIQVAPEAMANRRDVRSLPSGANTPVYYSILDVLEFDVEIGIDKIVKLVYWAKFPRLSPGVQQNWLIQNAYGCYLFGALMEAAPYVADDERLTVWISMYRDNVNALVDPDRRSRIGNAPRVITEDAGLLP